jgi:hypothetical protein
MPIHDFYVVIGSIIAAFAAMIGLLKYYIDNEIPRSQYAKEVNSRLANIEAIKVDKEIFNLTLQNLNGLLTDIKADITEIKNDNKAVWKLKNCEEK